MQDMSHLKAVPSRIKTRGEFPNSLGGPPVYSDDEILKAYTIAKATSFREASKATGIPYKTLRRRVKKLVEKGKIGKLPFQAKKITKEIVEQAKEEAREYITDRLKQLTNELYELAELAIREAKEELLSGNRDKATASLLRAYAQLFHLALQQGHLMSGKPTARPEVVDKRVWEITQRIIQDPDATRHAHDLLEAIARDSGGLRLPGLGGEVDPSETSPLVE